MRNINEITLLELVETYANYNNYIRDEELLSLHFDNYVVLDLLAGYDIDGTQFTCAAMIANEFCTYPDGLQTVIKQAFTVYAGELQHSGRLHAEQVKNYDYVGKYSDI